MQPVATEMPPAHDRPAFSWTSAKTIGYLEWTVAIGLTATLVWLHVLAARSGGALWRDEANTVALATLPGLPDVWANLQFDSFPMLWPLAVRGFASVVGPMNDPAFRALASFAGVAVVAALWFSARTFRYSLPLVSLALLGLSPAFIRFGDTMRAYALGIAVAVVTCSLIWRFLQRPRPLMFSLATISAIASVHLLFYNAVLLLTFCAAGVAVCALHRNWRKAGLIVSIGVVAALTLIPYRSMVRSAGEWNDLVKTAYTFPFFWERLGETLNLASSQARSAWLLILAAALIAGGRALAGSAVRRVSHTERDVLVFALTSLAIGIPASLLFLRVLSYTTEPWYYFSLMALVAVSVDAVFGATIKTRRARLVRLAIVLLICAVSLIPARRAAKTQLTDVDSVASILHNTLRPGDVVVVMPWHDGISFSRYYRNSGPWMTVPPMGALRVHRYDLLKRWMREPDQTTPVRPVVDMAGEALRAGHRVFVAGFWLATPPNQTPVILPPAGPRADSPLTNRHMMQWQAMVGDYLERHASRTSPIPISVSHVVSQYENMSLSVAEGWRP